VYGISLTRSLTLFGTCAALALLDAPARATEPATPAATEDATVAQTRFEQALAAYRQGRLRAAIEHFKEADRLAPSARISFNIAKVYDRVGDTPNALAAYRDYLRRLPAAENGADTSLRIAELELALQRSGVQQVSVLSSPPGASVTVDGVSRGVTPWTGELAPGIHALSLGLRGHVDAAQEFELPARHAIDVVVRLAPVAVLPPSAPLPRRVLGAAPVPPVQRAPLGSPASAQEASESPSWWTWALFGGSAALLASSGIVELSRRDIESELERGDQDQFVSQDRYQTMQGRVTAARVLLGMGVVAGALGGVSLVVDLNRPSLVEPALALGCDTGACGAFARGLW
jgi:tetratricopeptide (TPR) repeat protein